MHIALFDPFCKLALQKRAEKLQKDIPRMARKRTNTKARGLAFENGSYVQRMVVPADVRLVFGRTELRHNLQTDNRVLATAEGQKVRDDWKAQIAKARAGAGPEEIRMAVGRWKAAQDRRPGAGQIDQDAWYELVATMYRAVRGFDDSPELTAALGDSKLPNSFDAKRAFARAILEVEQSRVHNAAATNAIAEANRLAALASGTEQKVFGNAVVQPKIVELSGYSVDQFYDVWAREKKNPRRGKHEQHYLKCLKGWVGGNVDMALITKAQVSEFWQAMAFYPARRTPEINKKSFKAIIKENQRAQGTDSFRPPLNQATLAVWLKFFNAFFRRAIVHDVVAKNPFDVIELDRSNSDLSGEAMNAEQITNLFSKPLFMGKRDARFWIPVCAIHLGCRQNELVSSTLDSIKMIDDVWVLDMSDRAITSGKGPRVKNKASLRMVPIHPHLIAMGFLDYVTALGEAGELHLFPNVGQHTKEGAAQSYSHWYGRWAKTNNVESNFHQIRHTWRRAARDSGLTEEFGDLLSGHLGIGSMGRRYGQGANVKALKEAMDKIVIPGFPLT